MGERKCTGARQVLGVFIVGPRNGTGKEVVGRGKKKKQKRVTRR